MSHRKQQVVAGLVVVAIAGLPAVGRAAVPTYTVTDLGPATAAFASRSAGYSYAVGINAAGQVVGVVNGTNGSEQSYLYAGGVAALIPTLGGPGSTPKAINAAGAVVGFSSTAGATPGTAGPNHAFLYARGVTADLGTLPGATDSVAYGISDNGRVVGDSSLGGSPTDAYGNLLVHAVSFAGGSVADLGTFGGSSSGANGVNDAGVIVGVATTAGDKAAHGFASQNGTMTDLGTLGGTYSQADAVNANGLIVGEWSIDPADTVVRAFAYANGTMTDLGTLGGMYTTAAGVNNGGVAVGYGTLPNDDNAFRAVLFAGGVTYDLNALTPGSGWTLQGAYGINDAGRVVGLGIGPSGVTDAFLLTPVPEPAAAGAVGLTAAALAGRRRRR